jgi:hypothetical protein
MLAGWRIYRYPPSEENKLLIFSVAPYRCIDCFLVKNVFTFHLGHCVASGKHKPLAVNELYCMFSLIYINKEIYYSFGTYSLTKKNNLFIMKKVFLLCVTLFVCYIGISQSVGINNEGLQPHASAILDVRSAGKGVLIPRMSEDDKNSIVAPATGLTIYQTTGKTGYYYFDGTWKTIADNLGDHTAQQTLVLGNNRISQTDNGTGISINNRGAVSFRQKAISSIPADTVAKDNIVFGSDGSILARGKYLTGQLPATGAGMRFMWWPTRGAIRAGNALGIEWDSLNVDDYSVAFGNQVTASGYGSFAMGDQVTVTSTVGVGFGSAIKGDGTAGFSAGASNVTGGFCGTTLGYVDSAMGQGSVAIGYRVAAKENYSVTLGYRGRAIHEGAMVLSDASSLSATLSTYTTSSATNQFTARYANGYRLFTNSNMSVGVSLTAGDNSWNIISDSNRKEKFIAADAENMLVKIRDMRLGSWNYKGNDKRHYGPMAQDFYKAFGKDAHGEIGNDSTINQANMEGVMMIMLKALEERTANQTNEIAMLKKQNEKLEAQLASTAKLQEDMTKVMFLLKEQAKEKEEQQKKEMALRNK